ncbi:hypothetical protein [Epilithonimonas sp.]|uniref:hypothetical protein n=1 Tax=Epilithonimonas sp. TaxID=2894511 RepID=UPI0035B4BCCC
MSETTLPSAHQIGAIVDVDFQNSKYLKECQVSAVKFTEGKVFYDIKVPVGSINDFAILENVDSKCVVEPADIN